MLLFKKKNLIIVILALICTALTLCFSLYIYNNEKPAQAETAVEQNEPTAHADTCPYHGTPLTAAGTLTSGDYYLTGNLTISAMIYIPASVTVNLCLNGYMIRSSANTGIRILSGGTLNLFDCGGDDGDEETHKHYYTNSGGKYVFGSGTDYITGGVVVATGLTGGVIADGTFNMFGGTIAGSARGVGCQNVFNFYGGKICGNVYGIYVQNPSKANLYSGEITNNTQSGVYTASAVTVQCDVKIYDNTSGGKVCNVDMRANGTLTVGSAGLSDDATIGITVKSGQTYANGNFFTNNSSQTVDDLINNYFFDDAGAHLHSYGTLAPKKEPTCTEDGHEAYYQCSTCGQYADENKKVVSYDSLKIPALGHSWGTGVVVPPTCTTDGYTEYTCTNCGETKRENTVPALGHNYTVTWQWASDYSSATATYNCANCGDSGTLTVTPTKQQTDPTCTADGSIKYTATFNLDGKTFTDTQTQTLPAIGHDYQNPTWNWASDYSSATLKFTCANCGDVKSHTAAIMYVDDTTTNTRTYTATVTVDGVQYTDTKTVNLPDTTDPTDPTDPNDPNNPSNPTDPNDPSNPSNPTDPNDPNAPNDPSNPTDPNDPNNPTDPNDPNDPNDPSNPTDPNDPNDPNNPNNPTDPTDPNDPNGPNNPNNPTDPTDPNDPTDSNDPNDPATVVTGSGCSGCAGGIDWLLILCIGLLLFDVVMFAITMRVICSKPKDDDDDEEDEDYEFIEG